MKITYEDQQYVCTRRVVLDVLKTREPAIYDLAKRLAATSGISRVNISLAEIDQSTESVKIIIEGTDIKIELVRRYLEELGAAIHSVDEVDVVRTPRKST
jgi:hypothetical protein